MAEGYSVQAFDATNEVFIYRYDNGVQTALGTQVAQTIGVGDQVGIQCVGDKIRSWYKVGAGAWTQLDE